MGLFNNEKKIEAYALKSKNVPDKFLTITTTAKEAAEYGTILLMLRHKSHFESWCENNGLDKTRLSSVTSYYHKCISDEEKSEFVITKIKYTLKSVMAALRMLGNCYPIGCSFDLEAENEHFKAVLAEMAMRQIIQAANAPEVKKENIDDGNKQG